MTLQEIRNALVENQSALGAIAADAEIGAATAGEQTVLGQRFLDIAARVRKAQNVEQSLAEALGDHIEE